MLTECSFEIPRLVLPKSGFASLVLGILSVTTCEKTVSDSSIVTPESIYASKIITSCQVNQESHKRSTNLDRTHLPKEEA